VIHLEAFFKGLLGALERRGKPGCPNDGTDVYGVGEMRQGGERFSANSTRSDSDSTPTVRPAGRALETDASFRLSNAPTFCFTPTEQRMNRGLGRDWRLRC
jgi:hypothetical protein